MNSIIEEQSLINALSSLSSGPCYTYSSAGNFTMIDYIVPTLMPSED